MKIDSVIEEYDFIYVRIARDNQVQKSYELQKLEIGCKRKLRM